MLFLSELDFTRTQQYDINVSGTVKGHLRRHQVPPRLIVLKLCDRYIAAPLLVQSCTL